ncbi:MAG: argininosuccinate lyase [Candidatus Mesenet longicola]|nr:MAG: argininosuccinate lyase [Candidatus Mesenet longicola]
MKNLMWGARFSSGPSEILKKINSSIDFDKNLYEQDIKASIVHCKMLAKQNIISNEEEERIIYGLNKILEQIASGKFVFDVDLEDIHMNIEDGLKKLIGETAGKLHTARSRNDQVATDFKLWVRDAIDQLDVKLRNLQKTIINLAEENYSTIMPGFTHLQIAQPVTFGHHMMAYFEMLRRDCLRFQDARKRLNECPLGSAALAGTSFPIDRHFIAAELGFDKPTDNSLDSVADRDYAIEFLSSTSICIMHLSRLAEEIILWCSCGFKFIELTDKITTGSSIMPQKRNPDAAELIRAKTGRIFSALSTLLVVMKGLPLSYSKDMQEDKEPVFSATKDLNLCIDAMSEMLSSVKVNKDVMKEAAELDFSTATDIADWLVKNLDIPFRDSHEITGKIVKFAEEKKCELSELNLTELQKIESRITGDIFSVISVDNSVLSKTSYGGTSPEQVLGMIKKAKLYLEGDND